MTGSERVEVNRFLRRHGFGELGDRGLMPQLALCIEDETTLKRMLNLVAPEERTVAYESLRPFLRFVPRELDVLLAEVAMDAAARQLPIINKDGTLRAYNVPEVQAAVDKAVATGVLELVCMRCTKAETIPAISRAFAEELAKEHGWTYVEGKMRCPECSPPWEEPMRASWDEPMRSIWPMHEDEHE